MRVFDEKIVFDFKSNSSYSHSVRLVRVGQPSQREREREITVRSDRYTIAILLMYSESIKLKQLISADVARLGAHPVMDEHNARGPEVKSRLRELKVLCTSLATNVGRARC